MKIKSLITIIGIGAAAASCINRQPLSEGGFRDSGRWGKVMKKDIPVTDFTAIELTENFDVVYVQGDTPSATIEGNEKVIAYHHVEVKDGMLVDHTDKDAPRHMPSVRIIVTSPTLSKVDICGEGDLDIDHKATLADLHISISGTGDVDIENLVCNNLTTTITGAGDISIDTLHCQTIGSNLNGAGDMKIDKAKCEGDVLLALNGAGDLNVDVKCANLKIAMSGAGDAKIDVKCKTITANALGTGQLKIKGHAEVINKEESGLAILDTEDLHVQKINHL